MLTLSSQSNDYAPADRLQCSRCVADIFSGDVPMSETVMAISNPKESAPSAEASIVPEMLPFSILDAWSTIDNT